MFLPTPPSLVYNTEKATALDTFPEPTDTPRCVDQFARAARSVDQSATTLGDVNPLSVTAPYSDLMFDDGTDGRDKYSDVSEEGDSLSEAGNDKPTAPFVTQTEQNTTGEVTEETNNVEEWGFSAENITPVTESSQTVSSDDCLTILEKSKSKSKSKIS